MPHGTAKKVKVWNAGFHWCISVVSHEKTIYLNLSVFTIIPETITFSKNKQKKSFPIQTICFIVSNLLLISWKQSTHEDSLSGRQTDSQCAVLAETLTLNWLFSNSWQKPDW